MVSVNTFHNERVGYIIDIIIDKPLNDEEFDKLYKYVSSRHSLLLLQLKGENPTLRFITVRSRTRPYIRLILFILTMSTIFLTGYGLSESFYNTIAALPNNLFLYTVLTATIYTVLFLIALGIHEYGHMYASKKYGVVIDGPYFIPAPPIQLGFIGTLGAVIKMKTLPPSRRGLASIGIAGPINGFIAGLIISIIGIILSPLIPVDKAKELIESGEAGEIGFMPLIFSILLSLRSIPSGYTIMIHPLAFIGFIVFIVTFLNMLPIGQLDGGHVVRSYISMKNFERLNYIVIASLIFLGLVLRGDIGLYYLFLSIVMIILKLITGRHPHPGPANQYSTEHSWVFLPVYIAILVLTTPIPAV